MFQYLLGIKAYFCQLDPICNCNLTILTQKSQKSRNGRVHSLLIFSGYSLGRGLMQREYTSFIQVCVNFRKSDGKDDFCAVRSLNAVIVIEVMFITSYVVVGLSSDVTRLTRSL